MNNPFTSLTAAWDLGAHVVPVRVYNISLVLASRMLVIRPGSNNT